MSGTLPPPGPVPGLTPEEETALIRRAKARQEDLVRRLRDLGALGGEYRLDLARGRFFWIDPSGAVRAVAAARALCVYWLPKFRLTPAWAAPELSGGAAVGPLAGEPDRFGPCDQRTAWITAARLAEACGATWFYRAPDEDRWLYVTLEDLRAAGPEDRFLPGSPMEYVDHVTGLLEGLLARPEADGATLRKLLRSHAGSLESLAVSAHRTDATITNGERARLTESALRLRALADGLPRIRLGIRPPGPLDESQRDALRSGLAEIRGHWRD